MIVITTIALVFTLSPDSDGYVGETFTSDGFEYEIQSGLQVELIGYETEPVGELVIPYSVIYDGGIYDMTSIGERVFFGCDQITSVTFHQYITTIGNAAFAGCSSITEITFESTSAPSMGRGTLATGSMFDVYTDGWTPYYALDDYILEYMGDDGAFQGIIIWGNPPVQEIGTEFDYDGLGYRFITDTTLEVIGFSDGAMEDLVIPQFSYYDGNDYAVVSVGQNAFSNVQEIRDITISPTVRTIGSSAFLGCTELDFLAVPGYVTEIGSQAFKDCTGIQFLSLNDGTEVIGSQAFQGCVGLTFVRIPQGVASIGDEAFDSCTGLESLEFMDGEPPNLGIGSFATGTTIEVETPGWGPVPVMANSIDDATEVVWANPVLKFLSDPKADGVVTFLNIFPIGTYESQKLLTPTVLETETTSTTRVYFLDDNDSLMVEKSQEIYLAISAIQMPLNEIVC